MILTDEELRTANRLRSLVSLLEGDSMTPIKVSDLQLVTNTPLSCSVYFEELTQVFNLVEDVDYLVRNTGNLITKSASKKIFGIKEMICDE